MNEEKRDRGISPDAPHTSEADKTELATLRLALSKINEIRNSIVGMQGFNFSEHAYPLVAALNEAGFKGLPYPQARENLGTLIERATKAEDFREEVIKGLEEVLTESQFGLHPESPMVSTRNALALARGTAERLLQLSKAH